MALANKIRTANDSTMAIIQASAFYEHNFEEPLTIHQKNGTTTTTTTTTTTNLNLDPETPEKLAKNFTMSNSSSVSSPSSTNSNGLGYYNLSEEGQSVFSFKPDYGNGSLFSFDQTKMVQRNLYPEIINHEDDQYPIWEEGLHPHSYHGHPETSNSHHVAIGYGGPSSGGMQFGWMNDHQEDNTMSSGIDQEMGRQEIVTNNNKRPSTAMGESGQSLKKQCVAASKKTKAKCESPSQDPQSIAAKNRRERISERLKILQDLVPNGSKVDLVTMLEKAISYVKFLQLQVKVLATDELWPAQGGKAPDLSEVKDAIDAILASQREKNSK